MKLILSPKYDSSINLDISDFNIGTVFFLKLKGWSNYRRCSVKSVSSNKMEFEYSALAMTDKLPTKLSANFIESHAFMGNRIIYINENRTNSLSIQIDL